MGGAVDIEERDEGARPETWVKCWGGAVDLVSTDRNRPDRRRSERKTLPRNLLPATATHCDGQAPYPHFVPKRDIFRAV